MAVTTSSGSGFALYNGWKLPKLPTELDSSEYQYLYIDTTIGGDYYYLYFMKKPMLWDDQYDEPFIQDGAGRLMYPYLKGGDTWGERSGIYQSSTMMIGTPVLWTNHSVYKGDGSVALEASEPISLDGMTVVEWDGDTSGLPTLSEFGETALYVADSTFLDLSEENPYYLRLTVDDGSSQGHMVYGNIGQLIDLDYTKQSIADGVYWSRYVDGGWKCLLSGDAPSYNLIGTAFYSATVEGLGHAYTSLFAYRPEPTYDRTAFLSGLAMGLCGKGNPTFTASDVFGKGYLVGAELRRKRVLPGASVYLYGTPSDSGNIGLRSGESVSFYDGAVLPDINCLLTVEQKAKYPFLWIYPAGISNGSKRYRMYALPNVEVHYSSGAYWFGVWGDDVSYITAVYRDGQWGEAEEKTGGTNTYVGADLWKNFDISYESEVLSSASPAPIPVSGIVAYSYNGTVVSSVYPNPFDMPDWTMGEDAAREYPYKLYLWNSSPIPFISIEETYMFTAPVFIDGDNIVSKDGEKVQWLMYEAMPAGGREDWTFVYNNNGTGKLESLENDTVKWANFDVYNIDGSLYLEGTDAIPVYE